MDGDGGSIARAAGFPRALVIVPGVACLALQQVPGRTIVIRSVGPGSIGSNITVTGWQANLEDLGLTGEQRQAVETLIKGA